MILITGANGVVGHSLQNMLAEDQYIGVSRTANGEYLEWDMSTTEVELPALKVLIHCAPIWLLSDHLEQLYKAGVRQFIVFSSSSVLSKTASKNPSERKLVSRLAAAEEAIHSFCTGYGLSLTVLRPSLIYGYGRDQNISHIASFINRFGFAVVAGKAAGLRQPVHADDLASLCLKLLNKPSVEQQTYVVAGAEAISYRSMVNKIFECLGKRPIIIGAPLWVLRLALSIASKIGRFDYTADMADRMQQNLIYDNQAAIDELGFQPSAFLNNPKQDLPSYVD